MSFSNYTAQAILNSMFGKTSNFGALASAPTLYVALFTTPSGSDGTGGVEVSGGSYTRVATTGTDWNAATDADPSVIDNATEIAFPQATASWGTVTHFEVYDAATGGNYIMGGALTVAKSPTDGDTPKFAPGALTVDLT